MSKIKQTLDIYENTSITKYIKDNLDGSVYEYLLEPSQFAKVLYLINYLYYIPLRNRNKDVSKEISHWVSIPRATLVKWFTTKHYKYIIEALAAIKVIDVNRSYCVSSHKGVGYSKKFKLSSEFRYSGIKFEMISLPEGYSRFVSKMIKDRNEKIANLPGFLKTMRADMQEGFRINAPAARQDILDDLVRDLFNPDNIEDFKKAKIKDYYHVKGYDQLASNLRRILDENRIAYPSDFLHPIKKLVKRESGAIIKKMLVLQSRYESSLYTINAIDYVERHPESIAFKKCPHGRIHTSFSRLSKRLRAHATFFNEKVVAPDLRCSQIVGLAILILEAFKDNPKSMPEDMVLFCSVALDGTFYDHMNKSLLSEKERDAFKRNFFKRVLFCKIPKHLRDEALTFSLEFPSVYAFINMRKSGLGKHDFKRLSWALQKSESDVFIQEAAKNLIERNKIKIMSLHDGLFSSASNFKLIQDEVARCFKEKYNVEPAFKLSA